MPLLLNGPDGVEVTLKGPAVPDVWTFEMTFSATPSQHLRSNQNLAAQFAAQAGESLTGIIEPIDASLRGLRQDGAARTHQRVAATLCHWKHELSKCLEREMDSLLAKEIEATSLPSFRVLPDGIVAFNFAHEDPEGDCLLAELSFSRRASAGYCAATAKEMFQFSWSISTDLLSYIAAFNLLCYPWHNEMHGQFMFAEALLSNITVLSDDLKRA